MNEHPSKLTSEEFVRAAEAVHKAHKGKFDLGKDKRGEIEITRKGMTKDIVVTIHSNGLTARPFVEETSVHIEPGRRPRCSLTYEVWEPGITDSLLLTFGDGEVSDDIMKRQTEILAKEVVDPEEKMPDERFVESVKGEVERLFEIAEDNHLLTTTNVIESDGYPLLLHRASFAVDPENHVDIDYSISGPPEDPHQEITVSLKSENDSEEQSSYHFDYIHKELLRIVHFESNEMPFKASPQEEKEFLELLKSLGDEPRFPE